MFEDCYRTSLLPAAENLETADGTSMSSLGKATLHLHIANFKFSYTFRICDKLPETDILFGIDIQKRYSLSYSWDLDKQLIIQGEDSFLTYTRICEQQHNIEVVKSTLKVPPRHNSIIPITIKGNNLKDPMVYCISSHHLNKQLDPNIHVFDGTYNIKGRSTLHVLVANYKIKPVTCNKGQCIGCIEPSIDHMPQTSINHLTTQMMIDKHVQPDTFTSSLHTLLCDVRKSLNQLLETFKSQFYRIKQILVNLSHKIANWHRWLRPCPAEVIIMKHYDWVRSKINRLLDAQVTCSSHSIRSATTTAVHKGDVGKHLVIDYRTLNKVTWKFVWPMPRVEDIFSKLNSAKYFSTLNLHSGYHHIPINEDCIPKQLLHLLLGNTNIWRILLDWCKHQHTTQNWWIKY